MADEITRIFASARFKARSATRAEWEEKNPILLAGEPGVVTDGSESKKIKFGDGVHPWNELDWWHGPQGKKGDKGDKGDSIGRATAEGGEIFNSYEGEDLNFATGIGAHAEGRGTTAGKNAHAEGRNTQATGNASHTEGNSTKATAPGAHAEGYISEATAQGAHSEGNNTVASALGSHAEGSNTVASGMQSHSEGLNTTASGSHSHAEGASTVAEGGNSHAEGQLTQATGLNSHASGYSTKAIAEGSHTEGHSTTGNGNYSHAEGKLTETKGVHAHAEGESTVAEGTASHAEGNGTVAHGAYSHAEGLNTVAEYDYSHAEGIGTQTSYTGQNVVGKYNSSDPSAVFIVGGGSDTDNRKNSFTVYAANDYRGATISRQGTSDSSITRKDYVDNEIATAIEEAALTKMDKFGEVSNGNTITNSSGIKLQDKDAFISLYDNILTVKGGNQLLIQSDPYLQGSSVYFNNVNLVTGTDINGNPQLTVFDGASNNVKMSSMYTDFYGTNFISESGIETMGTLHLSKGKITSYESLEVAATNGDPIKITNVATPTDNSDVTNKQYVDEQLAEAKDSISLKDKSTGEVYSVYIDNGELMYERQV